MANPFTGQSPNPDTTAIDLFPIVASDAANLAYLTRRLYVGTAGTVTVVTTNEITVTFIGLAAGSMIGDFNIYKVKATGTTATGIVGFA